MDVDALNEAEGRLLQLYDAEAGDAEQHDLRSQFGGVESRIENIDGRDVSGKPWRKMKDRPPAPVGRDRDTSNPYVFDPERAGINDDRALRTGYAQDFQRKARNNRSVMADGESDASHDAVVIRLRRNRSSSLCGGAQVR